MGNTLNKGNYNGGAKGYKIEETLYQISNRLKTNSGITMTEYLIRNFKERKEYLLQLPDELKNIHKASNIGLQNLKENFLKLQSKFVIR